MTSTPTIAGRDDTGGDPHLLGPFQKVVALLQNNLGIDIDTDNPLAVRETGKEDTNNSTITPLLANATFTGEATDVSAYSAITLLIYSDVASATDGLEAQFSYDGTDWHGGETYTILAGATKFFTPPVQAKYFRIVYTNGSSDQTTFHLHTMLKPDGVKWSSHNIEDPIKDEDDAELVKAVITGKKVNGDYDNVSLTNGGNMKVSLEELESGISSNSNSQLNVTPFHADGTEGNLITGVDYVSGKSGIDAATEVIEQINYEHHEIHSNSHYFIEDYTTLNDTDTLDFCIETDDSDKWVHLILAFEGTGLTTLDIYEGATTNSDGTLVVQRANNRAKTYGGSHTAGTSATVMTDSTASFPVDGLIGWKIYNITDGSYGIVTDNDATTVTVASLTGGTDNDWDTGDDYEINRSLTIVKADCTVTDVGIRLGGLSGGDASNPNRGVPGGQSRDKEFVLRPNTKYIFRFTSGANGNILSYVGEWYEHTDKN